MNIILICYVIVSNLIGFLLMGIDKLKAKRRRYRIPEKTLFLTAIFGGSIGVLIGMHLFRHKTLHRSFVLGIPMILILQLILMGYVLSMNRKNLESPSHAVRYELNLIQELDEATIQSFVSYENLTSSQIIPGKTGPETAEAVQLFFKNFRYKILDETITGDSAEVNVNITNLDTAALARDLRLKILQQSVKLYPEAAESAALTTTSDYYQLLLDTLQQNSYSQITTTACFHLVKNETGWTILADDHLEDQLASGFITNINDPYLIPARSVLEIYLDAFDALDGTQWKDFLGIDDAFATYNTDYSARIDEEYTNQIASCFSWEILQCHDNGSSVLADVRVTSLDLGHVLDAYRSSLLDYADTVQSVKDDRIAASNEMSRLLLEALQQNNKTASTDVTLTMTNDGSTWNVTFGDEFTNALMGNPEDALDLFSSASGGPNHAE